jgi:hypothetical protein
MKTLRSALGITLHKKVMEKSKGGSLFLTHPTLGSCCGLVEEL